MQPKETLVSFYFFCSYPDPGKERWIQQRKEAAENQTITPIAYMLLGRAESSLTWAEKFRM